ncbi:MAG: RNA polymerase subunit sigma-70 [Bacteroidetes bacterium HGW-Bacteroidetes-21]|nr:MAG: RNA polymerase subunit sigma-70 [Bacteroidetes bacterium HGW-Bacteroidetes-21]
MKDEKEIIDGCRKSNRRAQKMLYQSYAAKFLGICLRYAKDRQEAEDVLQDGFVKIFKRIDQYSGAGSFEGWMKRIMVNTAITNYRQNLKRYNQIPVEALAENDTECTPEDFEYTYEELLKVVQSLPPGYRMVFNLFAIEGYPHKEIGQMMGIDVTTSKSQYSRARKILQKKLLELKLKDITITHNE